MRIMKNILKCLFWLLIIALLLAPLGLIYEISNREVAQYQVPDPPKFVQTAYGQIVAAKRMDVAECVTVSGVFTSEETAYQELSFRRPDRIRWEVDIGDEVQTGQVLGTYNGDEVISEYTGILIENNSYNAENAYLKIKLLTPVVLECRVNQKVLNSLTKAKELSTEDDELVELVYVAQVRGADGSTLVHLKIDSDIYAYGEELDELKLFTGYSFLQALVLPESALYQKIVGDEEPWYAYQVSQDGIFIQEVQIERGYSDGNYVCVTGVEAGDYFDTGYKAIAGGSE